MGNYRVHCTLTFGDIYAQVLAWMGVIFASLATALGLMGASRPLFALLGVGLIWCCRCRFCCSPSRPRC